MLSYPGYVFSRRIAFVVLSYPGYVVSIAALDFAYYYLEILLRDFVFFSVCDHIITVSYTHLTLPTNREV